MTDQPTESELKSCPFCGWTASDSDKPEHIINTHDEGYQIHALACPKCGAVGRFGPEDDIEDAWNTRSSETELQSLRSEVERLREEGFAGQLTRELSVCRLALVRMEQERNALRIARNTYAEGFKTQSDLHARFAREAEELERERDTLKSQNAELVKALEKCAKDIEFWSEVLSKEWNGFDGQLYPAATAARDALAKTGGAK